MSVVNVILLSLTELVGDLSFKYFARTNLLSYLVGGVTAYTGVIYFLIKCLRQANLMYVNGMWDGISAIISTLALYFIFGEKLNNTSQYVGLILIIVGVILLWYSGFPS